MTKNKGVKAKAMILKDLTKVMIEEFNMRMRITKGVQTGIIRVKKGQKAPNSMKRKESLKIA